MGAPAARSVLLPRLLQGAGHVGRIALPCSTRSTPHRGRAASHRCESRTCHLLAASLLVWAYALGRPAGPVDRHSASQAAIRRLSSVQRVTRPVTVSRTARVKTLNPSAKYAWPVTCESCSGGLVRRPSAVVHSHWVDPSRRAERNGDIAGDHLAVVGCPPGLRARVSVRSAARGFQLQHDGGDLVRGSPLRELGLVGPRERPRADASAAKGAAARNTMTSSASTAVSTRSEPRRNGLRSGRRPRTNLPNRVARMSRRLGP